MVLAWAGSLADAMPMPVPQKPPTPLKPIYEVLQISEFSVQKGKDDTPISTSFTLTTEDGNEMPCKGNGKTPTDLMRCRTNYFFLLGPGKKRGFNLVIIRNVGLGYASLHLICFCSSTPSRC
jgi:hypothetical protein